MKVPSKVNTKDYCSQYFEHEVFNGKLNSLFADATCDIEQYDNSFKENFKPESFMTEILAVQCEVFGLA
jgi:hypothetical protein